MLGQGIKGEVFTLMMPLIGESRISTIDFNYSGFKKKASIEYLFFYISYRLMFTTIFFICYVKVGSLSQDLN